MTPNRNDIRRAMRALRRQITPVQRAAAARRFAIAADRAAAVDEVAAVLKRRGDLALQIEALEARWLKLQEELEALT